MSMAKIRKGDTVVVLTGKDKGREGQVVQSMPKDGKVVVSGVNMIAQQLKAVLTQAGLEEINALGQPFDPTLHEAISQMESAEVPEGNVLHQTRRGYRLNGRLLRPASVVVAKAPAAA